MNIELITASDWGLSLNSGQPQAPGAVFRYNGHHTVNGVVFIDTDENHVRHGTRQATFNMNVIVQLEEEEADSTDEAHFRQYTAPVADLLKALVQCDSIAADLADKSLAQLDRGLVKDYKFTRDI